MAAQPPSAARPLKIIAGADSFGAVLKDALVVHLRSLNIHVEDIPTSKYYTVGEEIGRRISQAAADPSVETRGLVACGTGVGVCIFANKFPGVYAATCLSTDEVVNARSINNCNVLGVSGMSTSPETATEILTAFLNTPFLSPCPASGRKPWPDEVRSFLEGSVAEMSQIGSGNRTINGQCEVILNNGSRAINGAGGTPLQIQSKLQKVVHDELPDEADFDRITSADGLISVCGFGSLLSERSSRHTFPDLVNFRIAKLNGFRRVFSHSSPIFFQSGIANRETKEISSLSVEPCEGEVLIVSVFEMKRSEVPAFIELEHEYRFLAVTPETLDGLRYTTPAVLCTRYSDEEYLLKRCKGSKEDYFQRYGQYGITKIWLDDILPCRLYLRHCVLAAKSLSEAAYYNFLDHTYLGNRKTTIREYLAAAGLGIMEEEPPEHLKEIFGG